MIAREMIHLMIFIVNQEGQRRDRLRNIDDPILLPLITIVTLRHIHLLLVIINAGIEGEDQDQDQGYHQSEKEVEEVVMIVKVEEENDPKKESRKNHPLIEVRRRNEGDLDPNRMRKRRRIADQ